VRESTPARQAEEKRQMALQRLHLSTRRGFTLMEILIVAALIALFSMLAVISIQYLADTSKRKATVADVRTIGSVLSTAHMDFGIFPKIGYLCENRETIKLPGGLLVPEFDTIGYLPQNAPQVRRIIENWVEGSYLPNPKPRGAISPGYRSYVTTMRLANSTKVLDWPADPWGNPYVVYLLHLGSDANDNAPRWIASATEKANYAALVVSYGKNGIPGGSSDPQTITPDVRSEAQDFLLFKRLEGDPTGADYQALTSDQYMLPARYLALHNTSGWVRAGFGSTGYLSNADIPGILDPGSDDIVYQIP
jgi:prepilin-type N-terminal cleavage/methylation domain-containing protein